MVALALERFGQLDVAFNNAGALGVLGEATAMALSDWEDTLRSNLTSAFLSAKHQAPAMARAERGSILFTSSFVGHTATFPGMAAYAASKAGLIGLTQTLAVELAARGIRFFVHDRHGVARRGRHLDLSGLTRQVLSVSGLEDAQSGTRPACPAISLLIASLRPAEPLAAE